jgi:aerobic-type carbon monoxide dehydrogenase small subunit (CoxS/CutS family)
MRLSLNVNGQAREVNPPAGATLLDVLRDDLGLMAARFGCGQGACGACYVLADGRAVAACTMPIEEARRKRIVTVEGLQTGDTLHPVQQAFIAEDAMQCGYCTSGMLVSAAALLARTPHPSDDEILNALQPHLCRCGIYGRALRAVRRAAE